MNDTKFINKAVVTENGDLEFSIKDKIMIGKLSLDYLETESIAKLILKNLTNFPDFVGQINVRTCEKTTFAEFKDRSIRCALWLKKQGIGKGDVVSTCIPLQSDDYVPVLATLFIGAIINPWHHRLSPFEARHCFKLIQPKIMFATDEVIEMLVSAAKDTEVDCKFVVVGKHSDYTSLSDVMTDQDQIEIDEFCHVEPEDPKKQVGIILFSSGTTGKLKGTMLSYETLAQNRLYYVVPRNHINVLMYSTLSWIGGLQFFTTLITKHLTRILHSGFDVEETCVVIEKFKVSLAILSPTMLTKLCVSDVLKKYHFSQLEVLVSSGSILSSSILEKSRKALPNTHICNAYGMTETAGAACLQTKKCKTKDSVGRILGGVQLKILDKKSGLLLGANEVGEVCLKIDHLMIGYVNNPEETKEMIDDEGWLHSGDLGYYKENGEVWIVGRLKQVFYVQNIHVSPSQIEEILLQHPGVADAAVVPIPHEFDIDRPLAFVVKKPGTEVTSEELKEFPATYNQYFRLTGGVVFIDQIPYTSTGKKCIKDIREMAQVYVGK